MPVRLVLPAWGDLIAARNAEILGEFGDEGQHYLDELQERTHRYNAHVAAMALSPDMVRWALAMRVKYNAEYVRTHRYIADWITALLIVRYGEEPDKARTWDGTAWPAQFTADDVTRAMELLESPSNWPTFMHPLTGTFEETV